MSWWDNYENQNITGELQTELGMIDYQIAKDNYISYHLRDVVKINTVHYRVMGFYELHHHLEEWRGYATLTRQRQNRDGAWVRDDSKPATENARSYASKIINKALLVFVENNYNVVLNGHDAYIRTQINRARAKVEHHRNQCDIIEARLNELERTFERTKHVSDKDTHLLEDVSSPNWLRRHS